MTMVTVTQYGQYNEMYSVSKCWEKLGKDLQEHAHGNIKKLLLSLACSYRKGEQNAATTVKDEDN